MAGPPAKGASAHVPAVNSRDILARLFPRTTRLSLTRINIQLMDSLLSTWCAKLMSAMTSCHNSGEITTIRFF